MNGECEGRKTQVGLGLFQLQEIITEVDTKVVALEERLYQVLAKEFPNTESEVCPSEEDLTPLADKLHIETKRLAEVYNKLQSILKRLEL
jgi:hypothetical protein